MNYTQILVIPISMCSTSTLGMTNTEHFYLFSQARQLRVTIGHNTTLKSMQTHFPHTLTITRAKNGSLALLHEEENILMLIHF